MSDDNWVSIWSWDRGTAPVHVARYFCAEEFECKCGKCIKQFIAGDLIEKLDALRDDIKAPIIIHSGYRCEEHNAAVGGKVKSRHMAGLAVDISSPKYSIEELEKLVEKYFKRIGIGKTFIHVDIDLGKAKWTY